jgi:hypothetical protein
VFEPTVRSMQDREVVGMTSIQKPEQKKQTLRTAETIRVLAGRQRERTADKRTRKGQILSMPPNVPGSALVGDTEQEAERGESDRVYSASSHVVNVPVRMQPSASDARNHYASAKLGHSSLETRFAPPPTVVEDDDTSEETTQARYQKYEDRDATLLAEKQPRPDMDAELVSKDCLGQDVISPGFLHRRLTGKPPGEQSFSARVQSLSHVTPAILARQSTTGSKSVTLGINYPSVLQYVPDHPISPNRGREPRVLMQQKRSMTEPDMVPLPLSRQLTRQPIDQQARPSPRPEEPLEHPGNSAGRTSSRISQHMVGHDLEEERPVIERQVPKHHVSLHPQESSRYDYATEEPSIRHSKRMNSKSDRVLDWYSLQSEVGNRLQTAPEDFAYLSMDSDPTRDDHHTTAPAELSAGRRKSHSDAPRVYSRIASGRQDSSAERGQADHSELIDDVYNEDPSTHLESDTQAQVPVSSVYSSSRYEI